MALDGETHRPEGMSDYTGEAIKSAGCECYDGTVPKPSGSMLSDG